MGMGLALLIPAAFGIFGFLATFEPMPAGRQWLFRFGYALGTLGCLWAVGRLWAGWGGIGWNGRRTGGGERRTR